MVAERALDLFWLLGQLDKKKFGVWDTLTEEQRKEVSPYMLLRWLAGNLDEPEQLVNLADIAAPLTFDLADKKGLMLDLFTACTVGGPKRYTWTNYKITVKKKSLARDLIAKTYRWSMKQAAEARHMFTNDDLLELAKDQGWQADEVKELKKELTK